MGTDSQFSGPGRDRAFGFTINDRFYVGMGTGFINNAERDLTDFYEYNATTNGWSKKADVPSEGHFSAVSFSINRKGYVGLGFWQDCPFPNAGCNPVWSKAIWEYSPATDTWKKVAIFDHVSDNPAFHRPTAFVANNKAYILAGTILWQFDTTGYSFSPESPCPDGVAEPASFVINNKAYVTANGIITYPTAISEYSKRFYEYDPVADSWTKKADFPGEQRRVL